MPLEIQYSNMSAAKLTPNKPFVIFLYGFPGSGKTAFARQFAQELNVAHLQQDRLINELYGSKTDVKARGPMNFMTREFLRAGVSVIYDTNMARKTARRTMREVVKKSRAVPVLVWIQIDPDTAFARTQKRDRRKSDDQYAGTPTAQEFQEVLNTMQNPSAEDYVVISGKHTFQTQKAAVFKKFYELGILTPAQLSKKIAMPEMVNLVPSNPDKNRGGDIIKRNISIR